MVNLYDHEMSRRDLAMRSGARSQFAGVRLMTPADGRERSWPNWSRWLNQRSQPGSEEVLRLHGSRLR